VRISVIALTYARVDRLNECIESFVRQDYPDKDMVVLNTCPQQTLIYSHPNVTVFNLTERPKNLGEARNMAVERCQDGLICLLDDDDLALPNYLSVYAEALAKNPEAQWVWVDKQFYMVAGKIQKIALGACNTFAFTKQAWRAVGGYNAMNVGEDRDFIGRMTAKLPGARVSVRTDEVAYLYCWGNGVYHLSGMGDDKPHRTNSWDRSRMDFEWKLKQRKVQTGPILMKPEWKQNYVKLAQSFLGNGKADLESEVCLIELGRYGDIINILPVARLIAERYGRPVFMVNREFANVLDGIGYVQPHIVETPHPAINQALDLAKRSYRHVINAQIWGTAYRLEKKCPAYNLESWRLAGFENQFYDKTLLPEFDQRDLDLEAAIFKKLSDGKPMLLLKMHGALSAPFKIGVQLEELLRKTFEPQYQVVELSSIKTPHIYDLIGLFDRAVLLVTIDTMTLHLAAASDIPVVALVNNDPWVSSIPRCHCVSKINYAVAEPHPEAVIEAVAEALKSPTRRPMPSVATINPAQRKIFHAVERHDEPRNPRKEAAWQSWDRLYDQGVIPCHYWKYERDARGIGDKRALPYLKDVLRFAMNQAGDDDIVFFTNDDNVLHPLLPSLLRFHVSVFGACCSQRCDFRKVNILKPNMPPEEVAKLGSPHIGRDLFAFTKTWLEKNWNNLGDFILGASDWDLALASLIRLQHGIVSTRKNIEASIHPAELPRGYVLHIAHPSLWNQPANINTAASQIHNRKLFKAWAQKSLPDLIFNSQNSI